MKRLYVIWSITLLFHGAFYFANAADMSVYDGDRRGMATSIGAAVGFLGAGTWNLLVAIGLLRDDRWAWRWSVFAVAGGIMVFAVRIAPMLMGYPSWLDEVPSRLLQDTGVDLKDLSSYFRLSGLAHSTYSLGPGIVGLLWLSVARKKALARTPAAPATDTEEVSC